MFQNYALFPHMSVGENVAYGLRFTDPPGGVSRDERVSELLELVDLAGFESREPDSLSGGQQQRVALARALAPGPELLLLDEPMSALDARLRKRLRRQVKRIQTELGVTTVYVTHDQSEALAVSDRVAVLNRGHVEQVGKPRDVYHRPQTRFVASFIGENNLFTGTVQSRPETGGAVVDVGEATFRLNGLERPPGDDVTFCVRPEQFALEGGKNRLRGTVVETEFQGSTTRLSLDWEGRELTVAVADEERTTFEHGTELVVGFDADAVHVVD